MDEFCLARFFDAQQQWYAIALREIRAGRKRTHWVWFVFPQLKGLGSSANAEKYGLSGLAEARAYLADAVLGPRLREATAAMLAHRATGASAVLGELDALKFRSCLTLFALADPAEPLFAAALTDLFGGERDARTLELLGMQEQAGPRHGQGA